MLEDVSEEGLKTMVRVGWCDGGCRGGAWCAGLRVFGSTCGLEGCQRLGEQIGHMRYVYCQVFVACVALQFLGSGASGTYLDLACVRRMCFRCRMVSAGFRNAHSQFFFV